MRDALLLFLSRGGGFDGWLRIDGGAVTARGSGLEGVVAHRTAPVVAVVPGEAVTLRWIELPEGLSGPQAAGAARLMAADFSAQPLAEMHVAAGAGEAGRAERCAALVPAEAMAGWLETLAEGGFDPQRIVPETLLLLPPEDGIAAFGEEGVRLFRGEREAFAIEAEAAEWVLGARAVHPVAPEAFEAGFAAALETAPVDLRQGPFARRRNWRAEPKRLRRLALLTAGLLVASLAVQVGLIARHSFAADAAEAETRKVAEQALPRSTGIIDPEAQLRRRLADLRGAGAGFSATAAALFKAVQATPGVELSHLAFAPDGTLRATVQTDSPAGIDAVRRAVEAGGFAAEAGPPRAGGGRRIADLVVRPR